MTVLKQLDNTEEKPKKSGIGFRGGPENINRAGRRPGDGSKPTNRELRERELLMLLRKIKPHVSDAVMQASIIMRNNEASHQNQLKAATILLDAYRKLTLDLYEGTDPDDEGKEIQQQNSTVFSLRVIDKEENTTI